MKTDEKRYASLRLKGALEHRLKLLREKHTTQAKTLSERQMLEAIRQNDVDLKRGAKLSDTLREAFDFRRLEPLQEMNENAFQAEAAVLRREAGVVKDMVMLGTASDDDTIRALTAFCKDCPSV